MRSSRIITLTIITLFAAMLLMGCNAAETPEVPEVVAPTPEPTPEPTPQPPPEPEPTLCIVCMEYKVYTEHCESPFCDDCDPPSVMCSDCRLIFLDLRASDREALAESERLEFATEFISAFGDELIEELTELNDADLVWQRVESELWETAWYEHYQYMTRNGYYFFPVGPCRSGQCNNLLQGQGWMTVQCVNESVRAFETGASIGRQPALERHGEWRVESRDLITTITEAILSEIG